MDFVEDCAAVSASDFRTYGKFMVSNFSGDECQGSSNNGTINSFCTTTVQLTLPSWDMKWIEVLSWLNTFMDQGNGEEGKRSEVSRYLFPIALFQVLSAGWTLAQIWKQDLEWVYSPKILGKKHSIRWVLLITDKRKCNYNGLYCAHMQLPCGFFGPPSKQHPWKHISK